MNNEIDCQPLNQQTVYAQPIASAISYWQGTKIRLYKDTRTLPALSVIAFMLVLSIAGPWILPLDAPETQHTFLIEQAPLTPKRIVVLEPSPLPWQPPMQSNSIVEIPTPRVDGIPDTKKVRIIWDSVANTEQYLVYRSLNTPLPQEDDFGTQLGAIKKLGFEDTTTINANVSQLYYTVIPVLANGKKGAAGFVTVKPLLAIAADEIKDMQLKPDANGIAVIPGRILGTDHLGRDMLARLIYGGRTSLLVGIVVPLFIIIIGVLYGGIAGYLGGFIDNMMMRFADLVSTLPDLIFIILIRIGFGFEPGESSFYPMLFAMVILNWPSSARLVRGQVLQIRESAYTDAARLNGAKAFYIVLQHMLPNMVGVLLVSLILAVPGAMYAEAALSFIGIGVKPPETSWGLMCNEGLQAIETHPHLLWLPSMFIGITVLAFSVLGDSLRDALDVRDQEKQ